MKYGPYEIKVAKRYPLNLRVFHEGDPLGYFGDITQALISIIKHGAYLDIGDNKSTPSSLLEGIEGSCNRLLSADLDELREDMKEFNRSYSRLYNLCTDYYCKDVTPQRFLTELRPLLGITQDEADNLAKKRRTRAK